MSPDKLDKWAEDLSYNARLLSAEELKPILAEAGKRLLLESVYEPVGEGSDES